MDEIYVDKITVSFLLNEHNVWAFFVFGSFRFLVVW